jgi:rubrerythrin
MSFCCWRSWRRNIWRISRFRREHSRIRKEKVISGEAVDGMRKALAFEAEGREMYLRMSKTATNPQEKRFFKLLAGEEDTHFNIIYEYLDFLEGQGLRMRDG